MRAASPQTVDRVLGVLVAVCASAVLVAIGARAGPSITTLLRLTCCERCSSSSISSGNSSKKKRRSRRQQQQTQDEAGAASSRGSNDDCDHREDEDDDDDGDGGDAYHAYAYGARSGTATAASAAAAAAAAAAVRNQRGAGAGVGAGAGRGGSVLHVGSCHCGGLAFEVEAPEHLVAIEGPSKVRYPFITVPAEHFRLTSDDSNGSLYLLKCRPPMGRDSTPKVSAHFFCRRCGVHVVHAPDFPHAAVADVNVHCIRPATIRSLAVAFLRGGGAELPGMGDPVEGVFEVGRESWSDAMRERVSVALQQQPFGQASNTSSSRALSPRRRSASAVASASTGAGATNTTTRGLHYSEGVRGRQGEGEMAPFGAGGGRRAPDVSTLRRNAEERERARQQAGSSSSRRPPSAGGNARGEPAAGNSWGDVLMHVASLPSSSSAVAAGSIRQRKAGSDSSAGANSNANNNNNNNGDGDGNGGAWRGSASESVRHAEGGRHLAGTSGGSSTSGGEGVGGELSPTDASGKVASGASDGGGGVEVGAAGSRQRRSMSVDSSSLPHSTISSPGAEGVASGDGVEEVSGGGRSSAGGGAKDNDSRGGGGGGGGGGGDGTENGAAGGGVRASAAGGVKRGGAGAGYRFSVEGERDHLVRPPPSGGVSGGYAAAQA